ncbi:FAD-dependent oxidoreductase [Andreprevotia chitinilytica]|uniref:FAD-dependent oxidoreductase n=1 Tax=Andreprevotia chitinilytica TaxID=396808 RepID=UPI000553D8F5|nr:FAD-dependent monooxygenase [Andreprevotia chitinilytica]
MIEIGIVGAGPVGLTLACILQNLGHQTRVYEKQTTKAKVSKAFALHARTLELFRKIGVEEQIIQEGRAIRRMSLYSEKNKLGTIDFRNLEGEFPYFISIPQYRLEEILTARLEALGGQILYGHAFVSAEQAAESPQSVSITTTDADDITHQHEHVYLVGADGAHSAVRKYLGIPFSGDTYDSEFLVVDAKVEWEGNGYEAHTYLSSRGYLMIMPFAGRKHRIVLDIPSGYFKSEPTLDDVHALLVEKGFSDIRLSEPEWISNTRYHKRLADEFQQGNIFLAGDACHIHSPIGGQGLNTGIQDSFNLAWKMALVLDGKAGRNLLASYAHERRHVAQIVLDNTDALTKRFATKNPIKVMLRNLALPVLFSSPKVQKQLVGNASGIAIHYGDCSTVFKSGSESTLNAGQRLPDLQIQVKNRTDYLHRVLPQKKYSLLYVDAKAGFPASRQLESLCENKPDTVELIYAAGANSNARDEIGCALTMHDDSVIRLTQSGTGVILIRPDGYVSYAARDVDIKEIDGVLELLHAS